MFQLIINGEKRDFNPPVTTLTELLSILDISLEGRIIELNGTIQDSEKYDSVSLNHLDCIEIIQFMGGG